MDNKPVAYSMLKRYPRAMALRVTLRYDCSAAVPAASSGTVPVPGQGVPSRRDAAATGNRGLYLFSVWRAFVAQTGSLLCRRMASCGVSTVWARVGVVGALPITNRRYGRLPICATLNRDRDIGRFIFALGLVLVSVGLLSAADLSTNSPLSKPGLSVFPTQLTLLSGQDSHRLLVTETLANGFEVDVTGKATYALENPATAAVEPGGLTRGLQPGTSKITVSYSNQTAVVLVSVKAASTNIQISFINDVLPVLSKTGCNAGKCHAKPEGQNGFKLSVFAYDPKSDYREIVKDDRGRRVFPALPEESLILKKPTLAIPHEGGERFEPGSKPYQTLLHWIEQGMPYTHSSDPVLQRVEIYPSERRYKKGARQPLLVQARYSDGSVRDVTDLAEFDSNEKEIARVEESGLVNVGKLDGEAAVIARFMGLVAVSRITVPADRLLPEALYGSLPVKNFIDELAYTRFKKLGLFPSDRCTDGEFIRRVSLDVIGTLPDLEEVRAFLGDSDPEKRTKLIDRLLQHPAYADHWAGKWADLIRPNPDRVGVKSVFMLDQWLRESFRANKPYDQFVREIITAQGSTHRNGPTVVFRDRRDPQDLTTLASQVFLGVRLECAKCHHHPNEKWSQDDFYQFAAFFAQIKRKGTGISPPISGDYEVIYYASGGEVKHPVTQAAMKPKAPDGPMASLQADADPRLALADWMISPDNPFLARAVVNRVWAEFMGRGIVDPVDDFRASNPPSNEPLLDALAKDFVRHGYDLKHLMRTITQSHLYQLSSLPNEHNVGDSRNFSRAYRRRLPAEVLMDAVADVTGTRASFQGLPSGARAKEAWNYKINSEFLDAFGRPNSSSDCPCERDTRPSVVQALHLMNSNDLQNRIAHAEGRAKKLASGESSTKEIISELYLAVFSRTPTSEEISIASRAFASPEATRQTATEDVLWALMNSAEFVFNH
jgi:hypothetical protein